MISAMEEQVVGWPDLLAVVIWTEWMRSLVARSLRTAASSIVVIVALLGRVVWKYQDKMVRDRLIYDSTVYRCPASTESFLYQ